MVLRLRYPRGCGGFSLIELLVVVAITSILAVGVSIPLSRSAPGLAHLAADLQRDVGQMRRLAMISGVDHALLVKADGWQLARRRASGWRILETRAAGGARLASDSGDAPILFGAGGAAGTARIALSRGRQDMLCRARRSGGLTCAQP